MINFYKTSDDGLVEIDDIDNGCWVSVIAPTPEEIEHIIDDFGLDAGFVRSSLDEEESSRIESEDDQTLIIVDYAVAENDSRNAISYYTMPMGIILTPSCVFTISLRVTYGTFVICRMEIDANFMAVVLTILGYSINNTIVIYDRIRENERLYGKKKSRNEIVNMSINQSMTRSIHTTVSTLIAMVVITIVALAERVDSIISFSFPLIIGIISGFYSSVCLAGPLWTWLNEKIESKKGSVKTA